MALTTRGSLPAHDRLNPVLVQVPSSHSVLGLQLNPARSPQPFLSCPSPAQPSPALTHSPFTQSPLAKKLHTAELDSGGERNGGEGSFPRARAFWQVPPKPPTGLDLRGPDYSLWLVWGFVFCCLPVPLLICLCNEEVSLCSSGWPGPPQSSCLTCLKATVSHQKQLPFVSSCGDCESKVPSSKILPPPPRVSL